MFFFHFYKEDESLRVFGGQFSVALPRCGGSIERRGRREMEQPKVGPKGESRPSGKVEIDCRKAAPKEEQVGRACESTERERTHASGGWLGSLPKAARSDMSGGAKEATGAQRSTESTV